MLIDGRQIASSIYEEIRQEIATLKRAPHLAFLLVGDNPASRTYIRAKNKGCALTGIESSLFEFSSLSSEEKIIGEIEKLNQNPKIDAILVQLPLPSHIDGKKVMAAIDPRKDVDGFHPINMGKLLQGIDGGFIPCTPHGIQILLERSNIQVAGKHVVILGRSNIVGKPLAALLMQKKPNLNATVTVAHSGTQNLSFYTKSADILVAALGSPRFVKKEMVSPGVTVIDVGISRVDGKIVGDVDFEGVFPIASAITPVPGGVGPMTVAMVLKNTLLSYKKRGEP